MQLTLSVMFLPTVMRAVLLLTVLFWTAQPTWSRGVAVFETANSYPSETDNAVDWQKLEMMCLSASPASDLVAEFISARITETVTLPSEVNLGCIENLRGPPRA